MMSADHYDDLEIRSADARAADMARALPKLLRKALQAPRMAVHLGAPEPEAFVTVGDLAQLPVLRKSELHAAQSEQAPFGGFAQADVSAFAHVFQSPGPIYEPGNIAHDWWRMGRFLHACGIGKGDIVQNCFGYHMTPAGMIFENGARAVGATVFPAGTGQTALQARAAHDIGVTAYAGTPDFLKVILERADADNLPLAITKAAVGGGA